MTVEDTRFRRHSHNPLDLKLHFHHRDFTSMQMFTVVVGAWSSCHTQKRCLFCLISLKRRRASASQTLVCVFAFALAGLLMWVCFSVSIMVNRSEVHPFYSCTLAPWNSHLCSLCVSVAMAHVPQMKVNRTRPVFASEH